MKLRHRRLTGSATVQVIILLSAALAAIVVVTRYGESMQTRFDCQGRTISGIGGDGQAGCAESAGTSLPAYTDAPSQDGRLGDGRALPDLVLRGNPWGGALALTPSAASAAAPTAGGAQARSRSPFPTKEGAVSVRYVASGSDVVTSVVRAIRFGEAEPATTMEGMVDSILERADGHPISHLLIEGHGAEGVQQFAEGGEITLREHLALMALRPHLSADAEVTLLGCNVGGGPAGEALLRNLAEMLRVPVHATIAYNRPLSPGFEGTEVVAIPTEDGVRFEYNESWIDGFARVGDPHLDDTVRAFVEENRGKLDYLTDSQRYRYLNVLVGGYGAEADGEAVLAIFESASPHERRDLYQWLEHHGWSGDFVQGWTVDDDSLWNTLTRAQSDRLRDLLNEGRPALH